MLRDNEPVQIEVHGVDFDGTIIHEHTCATNFSGKITTRQELIENIYNRWQRGEYIGICSMCDQHFGTVLITTINDLTINQIIPRGEQLIKLVLYQGVLTHLLSSRIDITKAQPQAQEFVDKIFYVIWHPQFLERHTTLTPEMQLALDTKIGVAL